MANAHDWLQLATKHQANRIRALQANNLELYKTESDKLSALREQMPRELKQFESQLVVPKSDFFQQQSQLYGPAMNESMAQAEFARMGLAERLNPLQNPADPRFGMLREGKPPEIANLSARFYSDPSAIGEADRTTLNQYRMLEARNPNAGSMWRVFASLDPTQREQAIAAYGSMPTAQAAQSAMKLSQTAGATFAVAPRLVAMEQMAPGSIDYLTQQADKYKIQISSPEQVAFMSDIVGQQLMNLGGYNTFAAAPAATRAKATTVGGVQMAPQFTPMAPQLAVPQSMDMAMLQAGLITDPDQIREIGGRAIRTNMRLMQFGLLQENLARSMAGAPALPMGLVSHRLYQMEKNIKEFEEPGSGMNYKFVDYLTEIQGAKKSLTSNQKTIATTFDQLQKASQDLSQGDAEGVPVRPARQFLLDVYNQARAALASADSGDFAVSEEDRDKATQLVKRLEPILQTLSAVDAMQQKKVDVGTGRVDHRTVWEQQVVGAKEAVSHGLSQLSPWVGVRFVGGEVFSKPVAVPGYEALLADLTSGDAAKRAAAFGRVTQELENLDPVVANVFKQMGNRDVLKARREQLQGQLRSYATGPNADAEFVRSFTGSLAAHSRFLPEYVAHPAEQIQAQAPGPNATQGLTGMPQ